MRIFIALPTGAILEGLPKLDMLLDEVLTTYDLTGVVSEHQGEMVEFIDLIVLDEDEALARRAIHLAFGEALFECEVNPGLN